MPVTLYAIGREYVWIRATSTVDLTGTTPEVALIKGADARPGPDDWHDAIIEPGTTAGTWDLALLVGVDAVPIVAGVDYQLWVRIEAGDELIVRRPEVVTAR